MKNGDTFKLTNDAIENYGKQYRGKVFTVTNVAWQSKDKDAPGYHPGYDEGVSPSNLYDFKDENGNSMPFSVYDWEVNQI